MRRVLATKAVLWFILGGAAILAIARFARGMGPTTALTDLTPWGFWIGFDVMGGVALAAAGFKLQQKVAALHRIEDGRIWFNQKMPDPQRP